MVRQFFCNGEGNNIPVQLGIPFRERPEQRRDGFVQLLYSALGRWRRVAVIARVAHACRGMRERVTQKNTPATCEIQEKRKKNSFSLFFLCSSITHQTMRSSAEGLFPLGKETKRGVIDSSKNLDWKLPTEPR